MTDYQIDTADVLAWCAAYDGPLFHALLCDAPYEMGQLSLWDFD